MVSSDPSPRQTQPKQKFPGQVQRFTVKVQANTQTKPAARQLALHSAECKFPRLLVRDTRGFPLRKYNESCKAVQAYNRQLRKIGHTPPKRQPLNLGLVRNVSSHWLKYPSEPLLVAHLAEFRRTSFQQ